jgi:uncharacterized protein (UPF0332 family)/predicted nucleotidyltransferase
MASKKQPLSLTLPDLDLETNIKKKLSKKPRKKKSSAKKLPNISSPKKTKKTKYKLPKLKASKRIVPKKTSKYPKPKIIRTIKSTSPNIKTNKDIAMDFAGKVHKRFDSIIKATVLFGSQAKNTAGSSSDIDIIIIIDDAGINWDMELIAWYREELSKLITSQNYGRDLHVNTIKLTTWWNDLLHGDPVVINILRYGETLIDIGGFFKPLKVLLLQGKIHSTPEAVFAALQRAPMHLARSQYAELSAIEGVYWTMVDSAQAALITLGKLPPSPEHVTSMLNESFVESGMLKIDYIRWYRDIFELHKRISHGEVKSIKGVELDEWQKRGELFMKKMSEIIDSLIDARKNSD